MSCESTIRKYFRAWLENDIEVIPQIFSPDVVYTECYDPEYHGLEQILQWFSDWNKQGKVLEWRISRVFEHDTTIVAEWYFKCEYDGNINGFDGVTIADFDDMKICRLREFQSKAEHYFPYNTN